MKSASIPLLLLLAAACATSPEGAAEPPGYLRLADKDDIPTLDPARGYDTASWQFEDLLFSTLVDYDDEGRLVPEVARHWQVSPDGRSYIFRLRSGVRFTNGREVSAADFRRAVLRVLDPRTASPGVEFYRGIVGAEACGSGPCDPAGLRAPDLHTLQFDLVASDPLFLHKLAMPFAAAVPPEEVERLGEDFARHPVGSGPFVLREWVSGDRLVFDRNPDYFVPGLPKLPGIVRLVGVNDDLAWLKYEAGQLDVANVPPAEFPRVVRDPRYRALLHHVTNLRTQYLGLKCNRPPFNDRRVRQAFNHAVDKDKLLRLVNRRGVPALGVLPPNMPGFDGEVAGYSFDPARARALLADAGYAGGLNTTLWVRSDATVLQLAQSVQQDLANVGVDVRIKAVSWGTFLEAVRAPDVVPMFLLGWEADFPDASNFLEVLFHSRNIGANNNTNFADAETDALLDRAAASRDTGERLRVLHAAERRVVAQAPWVFLYHPVSYEIVSARVRDFLLHPLRPPRFERVWLESAANGTRAG